MTPSYMTLHSSSLSVSPQPRSPLLTPSVNSNVYPNSTLSRKSTDNKIMNCSSFPASPSASPPRSNLLTASVNSNVSSNSTNSRKSACNKNMNCSSLSASPSASPPSSPLLTSSQDSNSSLDSINSRKSRDNKNMNCSSLNPSPAGSPLLSSGSPPLLSLSSNSPSFSTSTHSKKPGSPLCMWEEEEKVNDSVPLSMCDEDEMVSVPVGKRPDKDSKIKTSDISKRMLVRAQSDPLKILCSKTYKSSRTDKFMVKTESPSLEAMTTITLEHRHQGKGAPEFVQGNHNKTEELAQSQFNRGMSLLKKGDIFHGIFFMEEALKNTKAPGAKVVTLLELSQFLHGLDYDSPGEFAHQAIKYYKELLKLLTVKIPDHEIIKRNTLLNLASLYTGTFHSTQDQRYLLSAIKYYRSYLDIESDDIPHRIYASLELVNLLLLHPLENRHEAIKRALYCRDLFNGLETFGEDATQAAVVKAYDTLLEAYKPHHRLTQNELDCSIKFYQRFLDMADHEMRVFLNEGLNGGLEIKAATYLTKALLQSRVPHHIQEAINSARLCIFFASNSNYLDPKTKIEQIIQINCLLEIAYQRTNRFDKAREARNWVNRLTLQLRNLFEGSLHGRIQRTYQYS